MAKVTFLGTADSIPSASRNHTSILLTHNEENILIDCGEGTQRQFRKAKLNPCKLTRILISHWHGDHVLGLVGLLSTLSLSGYNRTLHIYGPIGIKEKIDLALQVFSFKKNYKIVIEEIGAGKFFENEEFYLEAEEMEHGVPCLAYSFTQKGHLRIKKDKLKGIPSGPHIKDLKEGKDIVINGRKFKSKDSVYNEKDKKISIVMDTKMNKRIIPFVKDSDIFISEGTYSGDLSKEAEEHMHLTVVDVAKVARQAKVKKLIITHVSSRYMKNLKDILFEAKEIFEESYLPRDLDFFDL
ncbi:MAG: ribonuclease Z [Nanoarchaeota archaeon]|jgi:ribonuclease Z|nr:ribonuclease Z [Nanoarchaeota archaeon]